MSNINPFNLGSVSSNINFCNRKKEINDLLTHARNCTNVVLFSPRRIGKTSLIKYIMREIAKEDYLTIYVDFLSIISEKDVTEKFFNAVVREVGGDITKGSFIDKVKKLFTRIYPSIDIGPYGVSISAKYDRTETFTHLMDDIFVGLNKHLKKNNRKCLIIFDEFQEIVELPESKRIEGILREYIQNQQDISFFFVGSRRRVLKAMFADSKRAFYRMGFIYAMDNIPEHDFVPFMATLFKETNKQCPDSIITKIYEFAGGNTYYVQKLSYILWNMIPIGEEANEETLISAKNELMKSEAPVFQGVFVSMNHGEKKLVRALSEDPVLQLYTIDYLAKHGLSAGGVQKSLKSLVDKDIVEKTEKSYRVVDKVFGMWCTSSLE